jgi:hypothetical protein
MTDGCFILRLKKVISPTPEKDTSLSSTKELENRFREQGFNIFGYGKNGDLYDNLLLRRSLSSFEEDIKAILSTLGKISSFYDLYESYHEI